MPMSAVLEAALKYLDLGFSVIPLKPGEKVPAIASWKEYQKRPPTVEEVHRWFGGSHESNIAIVTGRVSGNLLVIDSDDVSRIAYVADMKNIEKLSMMAKTGKGLHIYERTREPVSGMKLPHLHIDIKGEGGYVVAPPSIHPSGAQYTFLNDMPPRSDVDGQKLMEFLTRVDSMMPFVDAVKDYWVDGSKNDRTLALAKFFNSKFGWNEEQIFEFVGLLETASPSVTNIYSPGHTLDTIRRAIREKYGFANRMPDNLLRTLDGMVPMERKGIAEWRDAFYIPGPVHVARELMDRHTYRTVREVGTEKEDMWVYDEGIYTRAEEHIRTEADSAFTRQWHEMVEECDRHPDIAYAKRIAMSITQALHNGPTIHIINQVLDTIRRSTFVDRETMNPSSHIPFRNGILNLSSWHLDAFTPELFFTWRVDTTFVEGVRSLNQTPKFRSYLLDVYPPRHVPTLLDYMAYCLYPGFPRHRIMGLFGRERIGKGVIGRILKALLGNGVGRIELWKLLIPDNRFALQNIEGKNVLIDSELKRDPKRRADFSTVNSLFGQDELEIEQKGKQPRNATSNAKGVMIGNLPLPPVESMAFLARLLIVVTNDERKSKEVPDIDKVIMIEEGDAIASLLIHRLRGLKRRGWRFANEASPEAYAEMWELLSNSIAYFIKEMTRGAEGKAVTRDDAYAAYRSWCGGKGITAAARMTFVRELTKVYNRIYSDKQYIFLDCEIDDVSDYADQEARIFKRVGKRGGSRNVRACDHQKDPRTLNQQHLDDIDTPRKRIAGSVKKTGAKKHRKRVIREIHGTPLHDAILGILHSARGDSMEQTAGYLRSLIREMYNINADAETVGKACRELVSQGRLRERDGRYSYVGCGEG